MSEKAVEIRARWLQCDADGCDHKEPVPAIIKEYIGKPCPRCGANLLTEEDFITSMTIEAMFAAINEVTPAPEPGAVFSSVSINPHGDTVTIKLRDVPPEAQS